eukprot:CAMPEP_0170133232 /NCGR_PEP_ID=MMETSP0033_2-20121228/1153_1 /TAXON_ID=195969 /ORGANISM="Dolichomastix tenuilepis, Strain CCMP3274" /LENGTH=737 /DNA_ID=CAMNT_0010368697 /DNA_START=24 /DNA_END=2237 /DNA_ORIENTATION=+
MAHMQPTISRALFRSGSQKSVPESSLRFQRFGLSTTHRYRVEFEPRPASSSADSVQLAETETSDEGFAELAQAQRHKFVQLVREYEGLAGASCLLLEDPASETAMSQGPVRFQLSAPRLGVSDRRRVTLKAVETVADPRVRVADSLLQDGADVAAEVVFPLDTDCAEKLDSGMRFVLDALLNAAEEEATVCLLEKGSDDRSVFTGEERTNKYHTGMRPQPASVVHRGSCTSSSPSPAAFFAAIEMARRLWAGGSEADSMLMREIRERVTKLHAGEDHSAKLIAHPSGTDAESVPLLLAVLQSRDLARRHQSRRTAHQNGREKNGCAWAAPLGSVTSIIVCAGEVGSGTASAAEGRYFSGLVPIGGARTEFGEAMHPLHSLARMRSVELVPRGGAHGCIRDDYDERVLSASRAALMEDPAAVVVLHTVAGSKTGICAPSLTVPDALIGEFGAERIVCVLDGCQMRHDASLTQLWLERELGVVLLTSSKFYAGPSFAGGALMSCVTSKVANQHLESESPESVAAIAAALAGYLTPHDVGDVFPSLQRRLPPGPCNSGLLLRWACGLHEMDALDAAMRGVGGGEAVGATIRSWVMAVRDLADAHAPLVQQLEPVDYAEDGWQLGGVSSIISFRLRRSAGDSFMDVDELRKVYGFMHIDVEDRLPAHATDAERAAARSRVLLGQPVAVPGGAVLRTCISAPQLTLLLKHPKCLAGMLEDDARVFDKLTVCAKHFYAIANEH